MGNGAWQRGQGCENWSIRSPPLAAHAPLPSRVQVPVPLEFSSQALIPRFHSWVIMVVTLFGGGEGETMVNSKRGYALNEHGA